MTNTQTTLPLGTIIHGTMRVQDTVPALLSALDGINLSPEDRQTCDKVQQCLDTWIALNALFVDAEEDILTELASSAASVDADDLLFDLETDMHETLIPLAEGYVPDYCYVGSHPGDGSDLGVWICEDLFDDTTQGSYDGYCWRLRENHHPDDENIPDDMTHALAVNDHGNATLYRRSGRQWAECWAIV